MLDLRFIRENPQLVKEGARKKHVACDVDRLLELDEARRSVGRRVDGLRERQKLAGKEIAKAAAGKREELVAEQGGLKAELKEQEQVLADLAEEIREFLLAIPNVPAPGVPEGKDDAENVELRRVGEAPAFDFEARDHVEIGKAQGWLDVEAGARLAGSRNYVLRGDLALLEAAVLSLAVDHMLAKGFVPVSVPMLVRPDALIGTGYFPGGEEQAYRTDERDDLWLAGTSEVPVTALHAGEILALEGLPKLYVARTTCYRREAGTYGKDTRGIFRVHQFQKVEQVVVDVADDERSLEHHEAILANAEEMVRALELPYRVVEVCGGDLGVPHVQKFDIETWMPSRGSYGETHSASRFHDYQARRLDMRYRDAEGRVRFCHTLNNTVAASTRTLIALLENHQEPGGTVRLPEALRPYMGGRERIGEPLG